MHGIPGSLHFYLMTRSPETVFGRAAADRYDPETHGEARAYLTRLLDESGPGLNARDTFAAFMVRLAFIDIARPVPDSNDRPGPVSGTIEVHEGYDG